MFYFNHIHRALECNSMFGIFGAKIQIRILRETKELQFEKYHTRTCAAFLIYILSYADLTASLKTHQMSVG